MQTIDIYIQKKEGPSLKQMFSLIASFHKQKGHRN